MLLRPADYMNNDGERTLRSYSKPVDAQPSWPPTSSLTPPPGASPPLLPRHHTTTCSFECWPRLGDRSTSGLSSGRGGPLSAGMSSTSPSSWTVRSSPFRCHCLRRRPSVADCDHSCRAAAAPAAIAVAAAANQRSRCCLLLLPLLPLLPPLLLPPSLPPCITLIALHHSLRTGRHLDRAGGSRGGVAVRHYKLCDRPQLRNLRPADPFMMQTTVSRRFFCLLVPTVLCAGAVAGVLLLVVPFMIDGRSPWASVVVVFVVASPVATDSWCGITVRLLPSDRLLTFDFQNTGEPA